LPGECNNQPSWTCRHGEIQQSNERKLGERLLRHLERRREAKSAMSNERMKILMQQSTHSSLWSSSRDTLRPEHYQTTAKATINLSMTNSLSPF
jgi:hypothetical protein